MTDIKNFNTTTLNNIVDNSQTNENLYANTIQNIIQKNLNIENCKSCLSKSILEQNKNIGNINISDSSDTSVDLSQQATLATAIKCMNLNTISWEFINSLSTAWSLATSQTNATKTTSTSSAIATTEATNTITITDALSRTINSILGNWMGLLVILLILGVVAYLVYTYYSKKNGGYEDVEIYQWGGKICKCFIFSNMKIIVILAIELLILFFQYYFLNYY